MPFSRRVPICPRDCSSHLVGLVSVPSIDASDQPQVLGQRRVRHAAGAQGSPEPHGSQMKDPETVGMKSRQSGDGTNHLGGWCYLEEHPGMKIYCTAVCTAYHSFLFGRSFLVVPVGSLSAEDRNDEGMGSYICDRQEFHRCGQFKINHQSSKMQTFSTGEL